jgi:hypothetical protein
MDLRRSTGRQLMVDLVTTVVQTTIGSASPKTQVCKRPRSEKRSCPGCWEVATLSRQVANYGVGDLSTSDTTDQELRFALPDRNCRGMFWSVRLPGPVQFWCPRDWDRNGTFHSRAQVPVRQRSRPRRSHRRINRVAHWRHLKSHPWICRPLLHTKSRFCELRLPGLRNGGGCALAMHLLIRRRLIPNLRAENKCPIAGRMAHRGAGVHCANHSHARCRRTRNVLKVVPALWNCRGLRCFPDATPTSVPDGFGDCPRPRSEARGGTVRTLRSGASFQLAKSAQDPHSACGHVSHLCQSSSGHIVVSGKMPI